MEKYSERLKELRLEKGLTLEQVASATKISRSAIAFWETGKRVPNVLAIITLARYFGVSSDYLLGLTDC